MFTSLQEGLWPTELNIRIRILPRIQAPTPRKEQRGAFMGMPFQVVFWYDKLQICVLLI